jgi:hypothetical protein
MFSDTRHELAELIVTGAWMTESPVLFVPVAMRETGMRGALNGARKEAYAEAHVLDHTHQHPSAEARSSRVHPRRNTVRAQLN